MKLANSKDKKILKAAREKKSLTFMGRNIRVINDSLRKKNRRLIGVPEGAERDRGPEYVFEQIIAENFPNLGRETGIQIQEIERSPLKSIKTVQHLDI